MSCLYFSRPITELAASFPEENKHIIKNLVSIWQTRQKEAGNNQVTSESVPTADELKALMDELRNDSSMELKASSKDELTELLEDGALPEELTDLAYNLGIKLSLNKRTKTISLEATGAKAEDIRFFKALAVDVIYRNDEAEAVFGMSPEERLDALMDWKNKKMQANSDYDIMGREWHLAKQHLYEIYGLSTDTVTEQLRKKTAENFSTAERMERAAEIVGRFSDKLTAYHTAALDRISERQDELNSLIRNKDKKDFKTWKAAERAYRAELGLLQDRKSAFTRIEALKEVGPMQLFDEIRQEYADLAGITDDKQLVNAIVERIGGAKGFVQKNLSWYKSILPKIVECFPILVSDACRELELAEQLSVSIDHDEVIDLTKTRVEGADENEDEGHEEGDVSGIENQFKENWQFDYDTASNWSKMSARVRHMLYTCPLGTKKTRFGQQKYMPVMQVLNTLLNELQGMETSEDMDAILQSLEGAYAWVRHIREQIAQDSQLKTELFRTTRRYAQHLAILQKDTRRKKSASAPDNYLSIINSGKTVNTIYAAVQSQISSGLPIDSLSVFDDGVIKKDRIDKIQELIDIVDTSEYGDLNPDDLAIFIRENPELIANVTRALRALGFNVSSTDVKNACLSDSVKDFKNNLRRLVYLISNELEHIKQKDELQVVDDIMTEERSSGDFTLAWYRGISEILSLYDDGTIEQSIRENGKVRYTYVLPSVLDDLVIGFQGKRFSHIDEKSHRRVNKTVKQFIIERFGDDPYYAKKTVSEDGKVTYEFRNPILQDLYNNGNSDYLSYITLLSTDTDEY